MTEGKTTKRITLETRKLIKGPEGPRVDFKRDIDGLKSDDLVALANAHGGVILIGVDETESNGLQCGEVYGTEANDAARIGIANKAANCRPPVEIAVSVEGTDAKKPIIRVDVGEAVEKPVCTPAGLYVIRGEGRNRKIGPSEMRSIVMEQEAESFVARFRAAADAVLEKIETVHKELTSDIEQVGAAADEAVKAAESVENAVSDLTVELT